MLKKQGYTYRNIRERLEEEGIQVSIKSLYLLVVKYQQTGSVLDKCRATRPRILGNDHHRAIDAALIDNDELTTGQILTSKFPELCVSLSTVKRARYELGWVVSMPK